MPEDQDLEAPPTEHGQLLLENTRLTQHGEDRVERYRDLVRAGIAISSEVDLDSVLRISIDTAARVTGARYGALGVLDQQRVSLERFITTGLDQATTTAIGELPRGRGLLGALIQAPRPIRLARPRESLSVLARWGASGASSEGFSALGRLAAWRTCETRTASRRRESELARD